MNLDTEKQLLKDYTIPRQPYSVHLQNIRRIIDSRKSDAEGIEMLRAYLSLAGVPSEEDRADLRQD